MDDALRVIASVALLLLLAAVAWGIPQLHRHPGARGWRRVVIVIVALTAAIGLCFVRYMPRADVTVWGVPLPLVVFQQEQGRWVDYVGSPVAMIFSAVVNVVFTVGVVHWVAYILVGRSSRSGVGASA